MADSTLTRPPRKPEPTRLPAGALLEISALLAAEADGHDDDRWKGHDTDHHLDALWRHLLAHQAGETIDPASGRPHVVHLAARALMALDVGLTTPDTHDGRGRPPAAP